MATATARISNRDEQDVDEMSETPDFGDHVDNTIFSQLLEMDDDDERDFSGPLVENFFEQADETFVNMDLALTKKDLEELSKLGHFLKGSSSTLGFNKIRDSCQIIQQYGHKLNVDGSDEKDEKVCLTKIEAAIQVAKVDKKELEKLMNDFFGKAK
ncbi:signal transduction histidine kinase [Chaetomium sp. MPI-SDFR-AT-0129]|uniref:Signal transduction histidine kinase n=1 Tax=Dichotomopilus funicola TaxID=1934379 RepID=A0AAN6ZPV4_9PEZI|nr:signal transduction histidine kinase [Chaetomium sp. MPI-SDFR-AT-0129]KAK4146482.1 signal transduction histidine kinase [Dichotomopilus funicola]